MSISNKHLMVNIGTLRRLKTTGGSWSCHIDATNSQAIGIYCSLRFSSAVRIVLKRSESSQKRCIKRSKNRFEIMEEKIMRQKNSYFIYISWHWINELTKTIAKSNKTFLPFNFLPIDFRILKSPFFQNKNSSLLKRAIKPFTEGVFVDLNFQIEWSICNSVCLQYLLWR